MRCIRKGQEIICQMGDNISDRVVTYSPSPPSQSVLGISIFSLILAGLGYLIYDSVKGAVAIFIYHYAAGLIAIAGFIPILGQLIYMRASGFAMGALLELASVEPTWLTSLVFWIGFAYSILFSLFALMIFWAVRSD